ncbi:MAG: M48 family metallopeptidase [Pseudanabaenales cyanobacterium]|nr:M48 family metallopeptidase [Pseudanabaenales cyanobacterium]
MNSVWRSLLVACSGALPLSLGLMAIAVRAEIPTEVLPNAQVLSDPAEGAHQSPSLEDDHTDSAELLLIEGELYLENPEAGDLLLLEEDSATSSEAEETTAGEGLLVEATESDSLEAAETASEEPLSVSSESAGAAAAPNSETLGEETTLETPQEAVTSEKTQVEGEETQADRSNSDSPAEEQLTLPNEVPRDPELWTRQKLLIRADRFYLAGDLANAEHWYRQAKDPLWHQGAASELPPDPITDPEQLPPGGAVYWRESLAGIELGLETRTLVPLSLLVEQYPEFVPGHARYADLLRQYDRPEEATELLQRALLLYPSQPDLLKAQVDDLISREQWLDASITARQFTIFNPAHPDAEAMAMIADENLERFRRAMRGRLVDNAIANVITGAVGFALTGGLFGPLTALSSTIMLLQGEQAIGEQTAAQAQQQLPMMRNPQVLDYVNEIGGRLAEVAGRDEFDYEFYVVRDEQLNAFALPGGKVFINAGAIMETHSEAELAGLLAHEMAHAVLSHGFQIATQGNLTASVTQFIPYAGNIVTNLLVSGYSREMEQQADILGTQMLSASGYAADGLHNLMVTLEEQSEGRSAINWFASHPAPDNRVQYLKELVDQGGYNRYTYEGVERHLAVQTQVRQLMARDEWKRERETRGRHRGN